MVALTGRGTRTCTTLYGGRQTFILTSLVSACQVDVARGSFSLMQEWCGCQIRICCQPWLIISSATNENLNFPLSKGIFHQWRRCLIESGFYFSFGQREAEMGWQYRLPVPVRTNVPPHSNISSVTSQPCHLQSFSNCFSLQLVSDRGHFLLSALIRDQMATPHFDVCS